ncbi:MAG: hypothetical protein IJO36_01320 [Clostridia bacterium]|nr:hypothetical protein [Clostridia bacterium]
MKMYPDVDVKKKNYPLQSLLFGHRIQPSQTKYEYLIEFLQVAIAKKEGGSKDDPSFSTSAMFPIEEAPDGNFRYIPKLGIGLKRFIFLPKSKIDGKAKVDEEAYRQLIKELEEHMTGGNTIKKRNSITIIQNLLNGFSAVNQSRSWFDQNVLPICPEVILPEGMGIKKWRQDMSFSHDEADVDGKFDYHKYTYMCRGGEVYYLHLLNALVEHPEYKDEIESRLNEMISSFPQFSYLCNFIKGTWEEYYTASGQVPNVIKELGAIPLSFSQRNDYTLNELKNFLSSKAHPFEKMETLANGIILQLLRMMYLAASTETDSNCWVIDVNCSGHENIEAKKSAIASFKHNEEVISTYLYQGLANYRDLLSDKKDDQTLIKDAANDSYRLFRKLGKMIGIIIPFTGKGMRFTLSEEIIKFLVLAIIPPKQMITLDAFVSELYRHFGMVIGPEQYKTEMQKGSVAEVGDFSFLEANLDAFAQKLKDCGFLRDLSDATSIVENPYDLEEVNE